MFNGSNRLADQRCLTYLPWSCNNGNEAWYLVQTTLQKLNMVSLKVHVNNCE
jgi:hypothetical protein